MSFLPYEQDQQLLLPPNVGDLVPEDDLCRVINGFVDGLSRCDVEGMLHKKTGAPPYHPRMMLKVVLYAYTQKIYSCRQIAKGLRQNICFMWLSGMQQPSFNTVNRFRTQYFSAMLPRVFSSLSEMLLEKKYIRREEYFIDGTTMEADAGKYTHIWRKNVERYKKAVQERALQIIETANRINEHEDEVYGEGDLPERGEASDLTAAEIRQCAQKLSEHREDKSKKAAKRLEKEAEKLAKYEEQEETLEERNSYSKTDTDATFMRTKEDLLRPGYNMQAGTQDGFVTGISIGQGGNDAKHFVDHMETRKEMGLAVPKAVMGDAIYGTEENYAYLEKEEVGNYLKYPSWFRELKGKLRPYEKSSFTYDEAADRFACPQGRYLTFIEEGEETTKSGYVRVERTYECESCAGCEVKSECTRSEGNRRITHSPALYKYQREVRKRLDSAQGQALRKRRGPEIETVFGHIKRNMGLRRFSVRGLKKVMTEALWIVLGYNMIRLKSRMGDQKVVGCV